MLSRGRGCAPSAACYVLSYKAVPHSFSAAARGETADPPDPTCDLASARFLRENLLLNYCIQFSTMRDLYCTATAYRGTNSLQLVKVL